MYAQLTGSSSPVVISVVVVLRLEAQQHKKLGATAPGQLAREGNILETLQGQPEIQDYAVVQGICLHVRFEKI